MGCTSSKLENPYDDSLPALSGPRGTAEKRATWALARDQHLQHYQHYQSTPVCTYSRETTESDDSDKDKVPFESPRIVIHPPSCPSSVFAPSPRTSWGPPATLALLAAPVQQRGHARASAPAMWSSPAAHVLSLSLDYMPRDALIALRTASKEYMDEADARLFRHVIIDDSDPRRAAALAGTAPLAWPGPTPPGRLALRSPHGRLPCPPWSNRNARARITSLLTHTRVLDYHCEFDAAAGLALAAALRGVETVRRVWPSRTLPADTVVDYLDLSLAGYWTAAPRTVPRIYPLPEVRCAVINIVYSQLLGDHPLDLDLGAVRAPQIVLTFVPRTTSQSRSPTASPDASGPPRPFGFLGSMLPAIAGLLERSRVTLVGLEAVPPALLGLPDGMEDQLGYMVAMGVSVCKGMQRDGGRWIYAEGEAASAAWRTVDRLRVTSVFQSLEDISTPIGRLWFPATASPVAHLCPEQDRYVDATITALRHWRDGFNGGLFGNGSWGETTEVGVEHISGQ